MNILQKYSGQRRNGKRYMAESMEYNTPKNAESVKNIFGGRITRNLSLNRYEYYRAQKEIHILIYPVGGGTK